MNAISLKTQSVPSLERGLSLLELIGRSKYGCTMPELIRQCGLPKSTVHSLLITLERKRYLYRNDKTGRYLVAVKLLEVARASINRLIMCQLAAPHLRGLTNARRMTTHMGVLEDYQALIVAKYQGSSREATWVGARMPVHCTGLGKALIVHLTEDELHNMISIHGLPRCNENTICSIKTFEKDLAISRERGFTVSDEECELGSRCLGAPIISTDGKVIAAISIAGTTDQIYGENVNMIARDLVKASSTISESIGLVSNLLKEKDHVI
jgi:DNA-binding IclR family transcriptional regulator